MSEPMIHPIERIRDAFARAHAICVGSRAHYMSIPPDPERDADLILTDAIEELAALRARVAELEREVERVTSKLRGWHSLECPCCGEEGAFATEFYEGGPIACGCTGARVCADGDTAWIDVDSGSTCAKCAALAHRAEVEPDPTRCEVCGWALAESRDKGCVAGDCSYRPEHGSEEWHRIKARREALSARADVKP